MMGCYGIGPGRVLAAAIEQNHDARSIIWPRSIAPFDAEVIALQAGEPSILATAEEIAASLDAAGRDPRYESPDTLVVRKVPSFDYLISSLTE